MRELSTRAWLAALALLVVVVALGAPGLVCARRHDDSNLSDSRYLNLNHLWMRSGKCDRSGLRRLDENQKDLRHQMAWTCLLDNGVKHCVQMLQKNRPRVFRYMNCCATFKRMCRPMVSCHFSRYCKNIKRCPRNRQLPANPFSTGAPEAASTTSSPSTTPGPATTSAGSTNSPSSVSSAPSTTSAPSTSAQPASTTAKATTAAASVTAKAKKGAKSKPKPSSDDDDDDAK